MCELPSTRGQKLDGETCYRRLRRLRAEHEWVLAALARWTDEHCTTRGRLAEQERRVLAKLEQTKRLLRGEPTAGCYSGRGRPSRASLADPALVAAAPLPELVTEPADRLCWRIRRMRNEKLLVAMHAFEVAHDRRKSVLDVLESRLRWLDAFVAQRPRCQLPLPFPGYDDLSASPSARPVVRDLLAACTDREIARALEYERATKRRVTMFAAIEREQRRRHPA